MGFDEFSFDGLSKEVILLRHEIKRLKTWRTDEPPKDGSIKRIEVLFTSHSDEEAKFPMSFVARHHQWFLEAPRGEELAWLSKYEFGPYVWHELPPLPEEE